MDRSCENIIEFLDEQNTASLTLSKKRFINRIEKLAREYPDEVEVIAHNEDGTIFAHVPVNYIQIKRPRQVEMSDERREELAARMRNMKRGGIS